MPALVLLGWYEFLGPLVAAAAVLLGSAEYLFPQDNGVWLRLSTLLALIVLSGVFFLIYVVLAVVRLSQRRNNDAGRAALALLFMMGLFGSLPLVQWGASYARFLMSRSFYAEAVAAERTAGKSPVIKAFHWDGYGWALLYVDHYLVFDETDEIAAESGQRSAAWLQTAPEALKSSRGCSAGAVHSLGAHYYVAALTCQ